MTSPPRFAIVYPDRLVEGGGADDEFVEVTFRVSRDWLNAPSDGVQAIVVEEAYQGRSVLHGQDHYYALPEGGLIHASDDLGPYLRGHLQGIVKFGLCLSTEDYEKVVARVLAYDGIQALPLEQRKPQPSARIR